MTDSGIQAKFDILDNIATNLLEWTYIILFVVVLIAIAEVICIFIGKLCVLFVKVLKGMFGKIKKPKFKELDFSKRKKQDNFPVEVYLNNAMWYLLGDLVDPERGYNVEAISELRYAMMKGHYEIRPDVMLKLSAHFPNWHFPEEEE